MFNVPALPSPPANLASFSACRSGAFSALVGGLATLASLMLGAGQLAAQENAAPAVTAAAPSDAELAEIDAALSGTVGPGWMINYRAAREQAAATGKDLLLLFTGSDWVDLCIKFDQQVLMTDEFFRIISEEYVPVRIDFPKEVEQSDALRAQNQVVMSSYRVRGFPTIMLTDATGKPFAVNGYQAVSAEEYGTILRAMKVNRVRRDEKLTAAQSAVGIEKAKLLAEAIPNLPGNLAAWFYRPELELLIANDLQNQTGLAVHYQRLINDVDYSNQMTQLSRNVEWARMISLTDDYIRNNQLKGEELQLALMNKISVLEKQGKVNDLVQTLIEIVSVDPETATGAKAQELLDQLRVNSLQQQFEAQPPAEGGAAPDATGTPGEAP